MIIGMSDRKRSEKRNSKLLTVVTSREKELEQIKGDSHYYCILSGIIYFLEIKIDVSLYKLFI